jgi:DNA-directed RNA polymerase specialized sigma24 family protein
MEDHLTRKHAIRSLETEPDTLKSLISQCALRKEDMQILYMVHIEQHDQYYIADMLGMSVQNMRKRYTEALKKLYRLALIREAIK